MSLCNKLGTFFTFLLKFQQYSGTFSSNLLWNPIIFIIKSSDPLENKCLRTKPSFEVNWRTYLNFLFLFDGLEYHQSRGQVYHFDGKVKLVTLKGPNEGMNGSVRGILGDVRAFNAQVWPILAQYTWITSRNMLMCSVYQTRRMDRPVQQIFSQQVRWRGIRIECVDNCSAQYRSFYL